MKMQIKSIALLLALAAFAGQSHARLLYGLTTTTWEEGNARVVSIDTDNLSADPENPTPFTEISTFEHAADFMAGTYANGKYYCFYNTYDQDLDLSLQYFGTLIMETGEFSLIAEENHVTSDNVTDMMDMTYDPVGGGLLGLDRQYVPSKEKFVSTIQNISMNRGTLGEVCLLDRKYSAICADGDGGFYLAELVKEGEELYRPSFFKADQRFNISPLDVSGECLGQSSFAHSMVIDDQNLYLASGSVLTIVSLADFSASSYYLEKDLYGLSTDFTATSGVETPAEIADAEKAEEYYTLDGVRIGRPAPGAIVIVRKGAEVRKMIAK